MGILWKEAVLKICRILYCIRLRFITFSAFLGNLTEGILGTK